MIPTMWLVGFVLGLAIGRWWAIPAGGIVWALLLVFPGTIPVYDLPAAAALGAANAAVGVFLGMVVRRALVGPARRL